MIHLVHGATKPECIHHRKQRIVIKGTVVRPVKITDRDGSNRGRGTAKRDHLRPFFTWDVVTAGLKRPSDRHAAPTFQLDTTIKLRSDLSTPTSVGCSNSAICRIRSALLKGFARSGIPGISPVFRISACPDTNSTLREY
jgi:hypothetical protein